MRQVSEGEPACDSRDPGLAGPPVKAGARSSFSLRTAKIVLTLSGDCMDPLALDPPFQGPGLRSTQRPRSSKAPLPASKGFEAQPRSEKSSPLSLALSMARPWPAPHARHARELWLPDLPRLACCGVVGLRVAFSQPLMPRCFVSPSLCGPKWSEKSRRTLSRLSLRSLDI